MAPGGLVEVRVSWPGHPRYLKKKKGESLRLLGCPVNGGKRLEVLNFILFVC